MTTATYTATQNNEDREMASFVARWTADGRWSFPRKGLYGITNCVGCTREQALDLLNRSLAYLPTRVGTQADIGGGWSVKRTG
jgi:hypothetical protein